MNTEINRHNSTSSLSIGLVGYGRMGQVVAAQAQQRNHRIAFSIDPHNSQADARSLAELGSKASDADIIIEFSLPEAVLDNAQAYAKAGLSAVVGTTGWDAISAKIQQEVETHNISYVHGGNFSIGAHLFMRISKYAASLFNKVSEYDVSLLESHHILKKDRPSGTALMTAELVLKELERKKQLAFDLPLDEPHNREHLAVVSQRIGHELGFHELQADSPFDTIKVSHHARTREGFALGAVLAAEWLCKNINDSSPSAKKGFITVHEFIDSWLQS